MVKFSNYIFCYFEFGTSFAPLFLAIQQSRKKHKNRASCRFVSSALTHSWVSYSNETYATLANSACMWFLAHAISAVGTKSLQPERTQRTAANNRRTALRAQPFSRTYCCWRCVCNVPVSNLEPGHTAHRTTSFNHVTRKIQSGAHWPQDFISSIPDIEDTKFMLYDFIWL